MPALGTRLRPLTDRLPKPMIPVWNKPLISRAVDHLIASGFTDFMVNTHQLPEVYEAAFAPLSNPERCAATERRG